MAAVQLLPIESAAAVSAEFTVAAAGAATLALKGGSDTFPAEAMMALELRDDAAAFVEVARLRWNPSTARVLTVDAAGTYRLRRVETGASVGAFIDTGA